MLLTTWMLCSMRRCLTRTALWRHSTELQRIFRRLYIVRHELSSQSLNDYLSFEWIGSLSLSRYGLNWFLFLGFNQCCQDNLSRLQHNLNYAREQILEIRRLLFIFLQELRLLQLLLYEMCRPGQPNPLIRALSHSLYESLAVSLWDFFSFLQLIPPPVLIT